MQCIVVMIRDRVGMEERSDIHRSATRRRRSNFKGVKITEQKLNVFR